MDVRPYILLAKAISATHGVGVEFCQSGGAHCACNGGKFTIRLPFSEAESRDLLYRGFIDHEVGHVRFTDFDAVRGIAGLVKDFANVFEDEFVERRMGSLFPGSKINLRNLGRHIFNEEHMQNAVQGDAVSRLFAFALYHRRTLLDPELGQWNDQIDEAVKELGVPDSVLAAMLQVVERPTSNTQENAQLARDFFELVEPYLGAKPKQDKQESMTPDDFSIGKRISRELTATPADVDPIQSQLVAGAELATYSASSAEASMLESMGILVEAARDELMVSALRKRIPGLLQTSRIKPAVIGRRGRLCGKRLARVVALDDRVFLAKAQKLEQDIEVGILADYSGSMTGSSELLNKAVYASLVMLKELPKVKSFAFGFHGGAYRQLVGRDDQRVHRFCGIRPDNSTPLGPAMLNIAQEFATQGRRILLVTTDGQPDGLLGDAKKVVRLVAGMGIEIYAIGIGFGARYLPRLFGEEHSAIIDDIADYPAQLEVMLRKAMLCAA